jgi:predicted alpha-1,6-mannanase (GH76 family)
LGVNSRPASTAHRLFLGWNYWWQAHLLDCLVDAEIRDPRPDRRRLIRRLIRGIRMLNGGRWTNAYYDDMAWLALALQRADKQLGTDHAGAIERLADELLAAWSDREGGGIPWRRGDVFKNTPANGPAAILLARTGHLERATATADWIEAHLRDPVTALIWDGLRPGPDGRTQYETTSYGYCQGVVLGADVELARRVPASTAEATRRVSRLVAAVAANLAADGVLTGHRGGDSGLFSGILARYLALVAVELPGDDAAAAATRSTAAELIARSADAAWANAAFDDGLPIFGPDWSRPAVRPGRTSPVAERDLSVQLSGWMLLEAAHLTLTAAAD